MGPERIKILVIDDNQDNLISLKALIQEAFPEAVVLMALNGTAGFELAATDSPDVILLDIVMPDMDGFEVCRKLKADEGLRDIPVVFVTALKGDKESRIRALECGAEAFLAKPIDEIELTAQIRAMVKIRTANLEKRDEKTRLAALVAEQTAELKKTHNTTLNLLEDLKAEIETRKIRETQLKQAEEMRNSLNATLDKQNKELEQVIYVTCHDLRSPLVTIEGFSEVLGTSVEEILSVLEHEGLSSATKSKLASAVIDSRESRSYIRKSIAKMISLLKGLAQVSRLGRVEIYKEELDMNQLISGILAENEFQRKEQGEKIEVSELPSCSGDSGQISQLFANLISNALKYSAPDRPGIIKISGQKEADHSVYCVEDNGIGIALDYQSQVFEMFHQLNPEVAGEGIGLNIVRKVVERHNGRVWVESETGNGSRFYVAL